MSASRRFPSRPPLVAALFLVLVALATAPAGRAEDPPPTAGRKPRLPADGPVAALSQILGRPTDRSITLSVRSAVGIEAYVEYGTAAGTWSGKTEPRTLAAGTPVELEIAGLQPNTRYAYRLRTRRAGETAFAEGAACAFQTQRAPGSTFTFSLQGDSHPEREGKMFGPALYAQTLRNVAKDAPDFHLTMGDDFSIDPLIERGQLSQAHVDAVYAHQRGYLGLVGSSSALFLVNGNHEQAAGVHLDGTAENCAVFAGRARVAHYPLPAPDGFYRGDAQPVEHIGLLRDYYAWTWGDALFVVLDPYWHCSVLVDSDVGGKRGGKGGKGGRAEDGPGGGEGGGMAGEGGGGRKAGMSEDGAGGGMGGMGAGDPGEEKGGKRGRDLWDVTLGDAQYQWFRETLEASRARYVFVFAHHVLGTGRGAIERAGTFEWGGTDPRGKATFAEKRPTWELPIHQLMVKHHVAVFFQGHDHLFARQELDGVVYQEAPNPADPTYTAFNRAAYQSGDLFPNSGHLRVTVSPETARVEYVRSVVAGDEARAGGRNGDVVFGYTVKPRSVAAVTK